MDYDITAESVPAVLLDIGCGIDWILNELFVFHIALDTDRDLSAKELISVRFFI